MDSSQTQIFGRAPAKALGSVPRPPMRVAGAVPKPAPDPKPLGLSSDQTQIFGRAVHASPSAVAEPEAGGILSPADFPDPLPLAMPRGEIRHFRVELPPAELDLHGASQPDAAEWDLAPPPPSRARILAIGAVGLVLLAVVSVGISRWVARRKVAVPPEAVATYEKAIGLLRRDDGASRKKARGELEAALSSFLDYLEARAALVVTLALQSDDAQAANQHAQIASSLLTRQIAQVEERKSTGDWQNRANVLADQLRVIHEQAGPLRDQAIGLSKLAESAWSALLARATELHQLENPAVLRAEMVYLGTRGAERAASLASHYPSAGGADGWDAIALGEFAANGKSDPATASKARFSLARLRATDPAFLRAYVLGARIEMAENRSEAATTLLDAVVALNPTHEVARKMLVSLQAVEKSEPDRVAPAP